MSDTDLPVFSQQRQDGIEQLMSFLIPAPGTQAVLVTALGNIPYIQIVAETLIRGAGEHVEKQIQTSASQGIGQIPRTSGCHLNVPQELDLTVVIRWFVTQQVNHSGQEGPCPVVNKSNPGSPLSYVTVP
jgi:hypothetical protein